MGPALRGRGAEAEERFPNSGKPPLQRGNPLSDGEIGTEGKHLRLLEEGEAADPWQMDRVRNTQMVHTAALHASGWDMCSQVCKWAGSWCMGIEEQAQSKNCCWLWGDGLRGREGGNLQQGMPMEEDGAAMEARHYC